MVTRDGADCKVTSPVNVPAVSPLPGRLAVTTPTETEEGAVPLDVETVSHAPPSEVVTPSVQASAPRARVADGEGLRGRVGARGAHGKRHRSR